MKVKYSKDTDNDFKNHIKYLESFNITNNYRT